LTIKQRQSHKTSDSSAILLIQYKAATMDTVSPKSGPPIDGDNFVKT